MTPQFAGINVPRVNLSHPEPQKQAIFSDFGSDLRQNGAFRGGLCSLEVVLKLKNLQFTFTPLVLPDPAIRDTG